MTAPAKKSRRELYREPSYVLLVIGIALAGFGFGTLMGGRHVVVGAVTTGVGLCLLVPMRILRSRSGRRP